MAQGAVRVPASLAASLPPAPKVLAQRGALAELSAGLLAAHTYPGHWASSMLISGLGQRSWTPETWAGLVLLRHMSALHPGKSQGRSHGLPAEATWLYT